MPQHYPTQPLPSTDCRESISIAFSLCERCCEIGVLRKSDVWTKLSFAAVNRLTKECASKQVPVVGPGGSLAFTFPLVSSWTASVLQTAQSTGREMYCPGLLKDSESRYNE